MAMPHTGRAAWRPQWRMWEDWRQAMHVFQAGGLQHSNLNQVSAIPDQDIEDVASNATSSSGPQAVNFLGHVLHELCIYDRTMQSRSGPAAGKFGEVLIRQRLYQRGSIGGAPGRVQSQCSSC